LAVVKSLPPDFDETAYLLLHPDVAAAVAAGVVPSGLRHYLDCGHAEGRRLAPEGFDETAYLLLNPDVAAAVAAGAIPSSLRHYLEYGREQGLRLAPDGFDEAAYLLLNPDVAAAVAAGAIPSGLRHYLEYGREQGLRLAPDGFDEAAYLLLHPDVAAAVAAGVIPSGLRHYVEYGRAEGRRFLIFDEVLSARFTQLERMVAAAVTTLEAEALRLDWALAACEGVTRQIDEFLEARETPEYQAAFEVDNPLVSVCVATMDRADLLIERAIRSLRAQTHRNLQIVVVGDHCVDDTASRLAALGDDRILFENLPERGPYPPPGPDRWMVAGTHAMNRALSLCEGQFVTHLDDDDEAMPDRISSLLAAARKERADFLWHPFLSEGPAGSWVEIGDGKLQRGSVTTGSIFYHRYFARIPWDGQAHHLGEPGDWNRIRKIKILRPRLCFVERPLLRHFRERTQEHSRRVGEQYIA
jgi:hypothetical protein